MKNLESLGAAAVGFNCVAADMMTPYLVSKLRRFISGPIICKPNAGSPIIDQNGDAQYDLSLSDFGNIMLSPRAREPHSRIVSLIFSSSLFLIL